MGMIHPQGPPEFVISEYLHKRVNDQIQYFSKKGRYDRLMFRSLQITVLLAGALIAIINAVDLVNLQTHIVSIILGGIVVLVTSLNQGYREKWMFERTIAEQLKKEKYLYQNRAGEYSDLNDADKSRLLVERVESTPGPV